MNNRFPSKETVERLREQYPAGTRVELISMDDPYSKLMPGDKGSVSVIDDAGTIFVNWDSGSGLGLVYGEDSFRRVTDEITLPMDMLEKAAAYILEKSARETTSGNYITYADDVPAKIIPSELFSKHINTIADILAEYGAVSDIEITPDGAIDIVVGLAYCPNYERISEEEDEYPDDRQIFDPLLTRNKELPQGEISEPNESEQNFAAWLAVAESSRFKWVEDEIYRLNGRGAMYYTGGEDGVYMRIHNDGKLEAGNYEGAIPHIGEAMFTHVVTKQFDSFNEAYKTAMEAGGKQFLIDMFSGSERQPVIKIIGSREPEEKPSVLKQLRNAQKAPQQPHKEKAPGKDKGGAEL